nr:MAG TPA: hypothetical protein [Caudoviricetes sp.]
MIKPKVKLKIKAIKSVRSDKPQYDENGLLLNPTQEQLYDMIQESEREFAERRRKGLPIRSVKSVEDILNWKN